MDLLREIDGYCERLGPAYWAEPVNAVTNAAFVLVAIWMWRRSARVPLARALAAVLFVIGLGSYLFHTHAQVWAAIADVVPIALFILLYLFAVNRDVWGMPLWAALLGVVLFLPYAALTVPLWQNMPIFGVSAGYMPVPTLILIYAVLLQRRAPQVARGFAIGAAILLVSLLARSLDETLCAAWPLGTHFAWHILNGIMLGWMIEVYRRHALEGAQAAR
ncbi:ceramidase domain-containing protein [uncultured Tateyamaria sp.]|uniref:ceramidase domain-containing protein n=1 Tax=Tateyamaria sp. 1078 TaxID=3417464 RepID=UPI002617BCED|nr:ceramidase domain-containing protein [uncultured Tateyamaria sp.]